MAVNAIMPHLCKRRDACLDWFQMLSGAALVLFMWSHMLLVSSVLVSPNVMNSIANFFETTYMAQVGGPLVFLAFLGHFILAARKIPFTADGQEKAWAQARMLKHRDTWLWLVQVITAMIILLLGAAHMWVILTDLPITAYKSAARMQSDGWLWFYLLLLPLIELHVSIGAYRIAVKWGFIQSDKRPLAKKLELYMFVGFMILGLATIMRLYYLVEPTLLPS